MTADASDTASVGPPPGPAAAGASAAESPVSGAESPLLEVVGVVAELRRRCPWDAEQTHRSLARYLLEETYEALEAIDTGDPAHMCEELGDVLFQVLLHACIAAEPGAAGFDLDDVARGLRDKLVSRHPHVFAPATPAGRARTSAQVRDRWDELKAAEKSRRSVLDGIPLALPALALADKLVGRAERVGVDVDAVADDQDGIGGELLTLVTRARLAGVDPEQALRDAARSLRDRITAVEG